MSLSFNDLDTDLQRSVFSATSIVALLLVLALIKIVHYVLLGFCVLAVFFMAYKLFVEPRLKKVRGK